MTATGRQRESERHWERGREKKREREKARERGREKTGHKRWSVIPAIPGHVGLTGIEVSSVKWAYFKHKSQITNQSGLHTWATGGTEGETTIVCVVSGNPFHCFVSGQQDAITEDIVYSQLTQSLTKQRLLDIISRFSVI